MHNFQRIIHIIIKPLIGSELNNGYLCIYLIEFFLDLEPEMSSDNFDR